MRNAPPVFRLRVVPEDPFHIPGRKRGSRRPHSEATVAAVRKLIEQTTLAMDEIAKRTGVGRASICRWTRDQNWRRPLFAPRATDTVPLERAGAQLRRRTLATRLTAMAERYLQELEAAPGTDLDKLAEALELVKMSRIAARPRARQPRLPDGRKAQDGPSIHEAPAREVMRALRASGVRTHYAPDEALADFIESCEPKSKRLSKRQREHRRMLERYQE